MSRRASQIHMLCCAVIFKTVASHAVLHVHCYNVSRDATQTHRLCYTVTFKPLASHATQTHRLCYTVTLKRGSFRFHALRAVGERPASMRPPPQLVHSIPLAVLPLLYLNIAGCDCLFVGIDGICQHVWSMHAMWNHPPGCDPTLVPWQYAGRVVVDAMDGCQLDTYMRI